MPQCPNPILPLHPKALEEIVVVAHPRVARLPLWGPSGLGGPQLSGTSTLSHNGQIQIPVTSCQEPGNSWYDTNLYPSVMLFPDAAGHCICIHTHRNSSKLCIYIYIYINNTKHHNYICLSSLDSHTALLFPIGVISNQPAPRLRARQCDR